MNNFSNLSRSVNGFYEAVYEIVKLIPYGRVYTYGKVAWLIGYPNRSRLVGTALKNMPAGLDIPAWRVVNAAGRIAPGWPLQRELLRAEGVEFRSPACVDLDRFLWEPEIEL